ncbi:hypothetical protein G9A89_009784 [Geosiphon pyriformis]|nr:hypothetical protein G9A89_009784 [Geosiphon pyriformis]
MHFGQNMHIVCSSWKDAPKILQPFPNIPEATVDATLYNEFLTVKNKFMEKLNDFLLNKSEIEMIRLIGHYLGGVMAVFAGLELKSSSRLNPSKKLQTSQHLDQLYAFQPLNILNQKKLNIEVFTYGSPRFGNYVLAKHIELKLWKFGIFHHSSEYWLDLNCDCPSGSQPLYECSGTWMSDGYLSEPQDCNKKSQKKMDSNEKIFQRLGPYFGYGMGYCGKFKISDTLILI